VTPYQRLIFATVAPPVFFLITVSFLRGAYLLIGIFITLVIAAVGFFVSCPNCGKNPTQRRIPNIPIDLYAPWFSERCPHCRKSLSRREEESAAKPD
jgi:hypothetical protein